MVKDKPGLESFKKCQHRRHTANITQTCLNLSDSAGPNVADVNSMKSTKVLGLVYSLGRQKDKNFKNIDFCVIGKHLNEKFQHFRQPLTKEKKPSCVNEKSWKTYFRDI